MSDRLGDAEADVVAWQVVMDPDEDRFAIVGVECRAREDSVEAPDWIFRQIRMESVKCLPLMNFVELLWRVLSPGLVRLRDGRRKKHGSRYGSGGGWNGELLDKRPRIGAGRRIFGERFPTFG